MACTWLATAIKAVLRMAVAVFAIAFILLAYAKSTEWWRDGVTETAGAGVRLGDYPVHNEEHQVAAAAAYQVTSTWSGPVTFAITLQWGCVLLAALCATALHSWSRFLGSRNSTGNAATSSRVCQAAKKVWHALGDPVPPARLWRWWCGGLSGRELILVLTWAGLLITHLCCNLSQQHLSDIHSGVDAEGVSLSTLQRSVGAISKALGQSLRPLVILMSFPISRSSFLQWITGLDHPSLVKYHRWMAWGAGSVMVVHGVSHLLLWASTNQLSDQLSLSSPEGARHWTGLLALLSALLILCTSVESVRKRFFWVFYKVHIAGFLCFTLFMLMHCNNLIQWGFPALVLYGMDRAFRYWQLAFNWVRVSPVEYHVDDKVITVNLPWACSSSAIVPGQTLYLRCTAISLFQSHPFSVADVATDTNCPESVASVRVTLHLRVRGPWTRALAQKMEAGETILLQVEGPYSSQVHVPEETPVVVMVAGGIGITTVLGLLRQWARQEARTGTEDAVASPDRAPEPQPPRVYLVWSSRCAAELRLFQDLLCGPGSGTSTAGSASPMLGATWANNLTPRLQLASSHPGYLINPFAMAPHDNDYPSTPLSPDHCSPHGLREISEFGGDHHAASSSDISTQSPLNTLDDIQLPLPCVTPRLAQAPAPLQSLPSSPTLQRPLLSFQDCSFTLPARTAASKPACPCKFLHASLHYTGNEISSPPPPTTTPSDTTAPVTSHAAWPSALALNTMSRQPSRLSICTPNKQATQPRVTPSDKQPTGMANVRITPSPLHDRLALDTSSLTPDGSVALDMTPVTTAATQPHCKRLLQVNPMAAPGRYAVCLVLSFLGAWAGLLAGGRFLTATTNSMQVGALQWSCMAAGALFPPFVLLSILSSTGTVRKQPCGNQSKVAQTTGSKPKLMQVHAAEHVTELVGMDSWVISTEPAALQACDVTQQLGTSKRPHSMNNGTGPAAGPGSDRSSPLQGLASPALPRELSHAWSASSMVIDRKARPQAEVIQGKLPGLPCDVVFGRPDVAGLLQRVRNENPSVTEIPVLVAGPDGLSETVRGLCRAMPAAGPAFRFQQAAHHA